MSRHDIRLRLARGLAAAVCGLAALSGCGSPARTTLTVHAPAQVASTPWYTISLPADMRDMQSLVVTPTDPATMYACTTAVESTPVAGAVEGSYSVWRSTDAGYHWTLLAAPALSGNNCVVAIAPEDARRVAVMAIYSGTNPDNMPCQPATIVLSIDGGDQWHTVPFQAAPITPQPSDTPVGCLIQVGARYLYWTSTYVTGVDANSQVTVLERGDADGHWTRIDTAFGQASEYYPWQAGDGDTLLASVGQPIGPQPSYHPRHLWITTNGGDTWQDMGALPLGVDSFVIPTSGGEPGGPTSRAPWYALIAEQIPSNLYRLQVLQSGDGRHWTALPPLPIAGASAQRMGLLLALGVTPDGRLLALGPDPTKGVPDPQAAQEVSTPAFWLWIWSPRVGRWQVMPEPLRQPASEGCGLCWGSQIARGPDGATYLYLMRWWDSPIGMFRVRVPDGA